MWSSNWLIGWLVGWFLWHINNGLLFNAKSYFIYISNTFDL